MKYGSRALDIAKCKSATKVVSEEDLIAAIQTVKAAVESGGLDTEIEAASGS